MRMGSVETRLTRLARRAKLDGWVMLVPTGTGLQWALVDPDDLNRVVFLAGRTARDAEDTLRGILRRLEG